MFQRAALVMLCLAAGGCMISEQEGRLTPEGNPRYHVGQGIQPAEIHFRSPLNYGIVFGRSLGLCLVALFFLKSGPGRTRSAVTTVIGAGLLAAAIWLLVRDLPTLLKYRIGLVDAGLELSIPPESPRTIPWDGIEEMKIEGSSWYSSGQSRFENAPILELAEWESVELGLAGDETLTLDVSKLSIEQRKTVWAAIAARAQLVKAD